MKKWNCTDPDSYQWQSKSPKSNPFETEYSMCELIRVNGGYAICHGIFTLDEYADDLQKSANFMGYKLKTLLDSKNYDLMAECVFEYSCEDFIENPYGPAPVYSTATEACQRLDYWMGEPHRNMWLS